MDLSFYTDMMKTQKALSGISAGVKLASALPRNPLIPATSAFAAATMAPAAVAMTRSIVNNHRLDLVRGASLAATGVSSLLNRVSVMAKSPYTSSALELMAKPDVTGFSALHSAFHKTDAAVSGLAAISTAMTKSPWSTLPVTQRLSSQLSAAEAILGHPALRSMDLSKAVTGLSAVEWQRATDMTRLLSTTPQHATFSSIQHNLLRTQYDPIGMAKLGQIRSVSNLSSLLGAPGIKDITGIYSTTVANSAMDLVAKNSAVLGVFTSQMKAVTLGLSPAALQAASLFRSKDSVLSALSSVNWISPERMINPVGIDYKRLTTLIPNCGLSTRDLTSRPSFESPTVTRKVKINMVLIRKLASINSSVEESYRGAVHVLNDRGPDFARHMCVSLRQMFDFVVMHLPNKQQLIDFFEREQHTRFTNKQKYGEKPAENRRNNSRVAFRFLTDKRPGDLTDDEFMDLYYKSNNGVHTFRPNYSYETARDIFDRSEAIMFYIIEAYEVTNN